MKGDLSPSFRCPSQRLILSPSQARLTETFIHQPKLYSAPPTISSITWGFGVLGFWGFGVVAVGVIDDGGNDDDDDDGNDDDDDDNYDS